MSGSLKAFRLHGLLDNMPELISVYHEDGELFVVMHRKPKQPIPKTFEGTPVVLLVPA